MKRVLVIGSGAREHALAWKLSESPQVGQVIVAPGNDGYPKNWERWSVQLVGGTPEFKQLAELAVRAEIDLVVIGPDNPLAEGIVDVLVQAGLKVFGPSAAAARIEASKAFAKEVMIQAGVPTARFKVVGTAEAAREFLISASWPESDGTGWVVKADGLALGKGVRVCATLEEGLEAAQELIGLSGGLVIEERLQGEEISWMAFCDGAHCALMDPARDYKRVGEGDLGPNTGGMGAFSPVPGIPNHWSERVKNEVFLPTLREMERRGTPFKGVLFAGLMVDLARDRYWVLEFNARFGDPETQVLMPRMSGDLYEWCLACAEGDLARMPEKVPFLSEKAVYVVGTAAGYPDQPRKGAIIHGPLQAAEPDEGAQACEGTRDAGGMPHYFCAGIVQTPQGLAVSGGRVFGALGMAPGFKQARDQAYERVRQVTFEGLYYRKDIAQGLA